MPPLVVAHQSLLDTVKHRQVHAPVQLRNPVVALPLLAVHVRHVWLDQTKIGGHMVVQPFQVYVLLPVPDKDINPNPTYLKSRYNPNILT